MAHDEDFHVRPGRIRSKGSSARPRSFLTQVLHASRRAGGGAGGSPVKGKGSSPRPGPSTFGRGHSRFGRSRLFDAHRRVTVKARVVRQAGRGARPGSLADHLAYLRRDGVTHDGEKAHLFGPDGQEVDAQDFAARCKDDRHHFRFIVSPEDAPEMADLDGFTRDLVTKMEADLGTRLDWAAVSHWNTDNPHVHLLVRGVDQAGADLVIARDYISHGLRSRAEDLVSLELGPRAEHEIETALRRDVTAERWTRLDAELQRHADDLGIVDLRADATTGFGQDATHRALLTGRAQTLERMGLATSAGPGRWSLSPGLEDTLREMGARGDIIKTMHRAMTERSRDRGMSPGDYVISGRDQPVALTGRLLERGLHNELTGEAYAVIDATDGRVHHVRFPGVEAFRDAPPDGGIVEVRTATGRTSGKDYLVLSARSDLDLAAQVKAPGATWLDHRLVERQPMNLARTGFGAEVRQAMQERTRHLADRGLASFQQDGSVRYQRNLLATLRQQELDQVGAKLAQQTGLAYERSIPGHFVTGQYVKRLNLSSGRFAMIDNGLGFQLVPWAPSLEKQHDRYVDGVARDDGGVDWRHDRKRDLGISL
ncbi:relaxase/mobilization nuclease domain-containing protein [Acetobacter persici]|uniref:Type VI secretion protein n=1 Tax=Acetobacter persici TaxID=1076596 RepID=A0A6V8IAV7_9PROT|nr:VirD2 family relaxase/mobilization nuclease [Acetobacter persici]OUI91211.1 type VI secretion protein [Acetobacter persici]GFE94720.1 type VI secretion protein [Acetobacter persici]